MATAVYVQSPGMVQLQPGYVTVPGASDPDIEEAYMSKQSRNLGVALVVIGIMAFIINGVGFAYNDAFAVLGHGFWCGTLFIFTGGFGIGAVSKRRCLIVTFMVLGIFSVIVTIFMFFISLGGAFANTACLSIRATCGSRNEAILLEAFLAALALAAAVVLIWSLVICCLAVCCCRSTQRVVVTAPATNQQMFISQQPGTVQYGNQHVMTVQMSPPAYQMQQAPGQQQFMATGSYLPQYGYSTASAPPSVDGPSASGVFIPMMSAPPPYAEVNSQKEFAHKV